MKILITGGAGYKGVLLAEGLLEAGHHVTIMDNFMYGYESILHIVSHKKLHILSLDVRNLKAKDVKGFDVIYHLAGISGYPACEVNPHSAQIINVDATRGLVKLVGKSQFIIYASTTSFYGSSGKQCDERTKIAPVSLYGITRYEAEKIVQQRENSISFRFATVFGISPKMRNDLLVNDFTYRAINDRSLVIFDGHSKRTVIHIKDAIRAYIFALDKLEKMKGEVYNVGNRDLNVSKNDIAKAIKKYVPFEIIDSTLPDKDLRNFVISFNKLDKLGYGTRYTLDDGVFDLVKLYRFYKTHLNYRII